MRHTCVRALAAFCALAMTGLAQDIYRFTEKGRLHAYRLESQATSKESREAAAKGALVFYDLEELPSEARLAQMAPTRREARLKAARRIMTNKLHVRLKEEAQWKTLGETHPEGRESSVVKGWTVVKYADPAAAWKAVQWMMAEGGFEFAPLFARQMSTRQSGPLQRPVNDPLFPKQWHLTADLGLRLRGSWDVATGRGINMTVIDDGLDVNHEDLSSNVYPLEGGFHRNFNEGPPSNPSPLKADENHGTSCAGLAAARGFNNLGVIGVAPEARMMGLRLIAGPNDDEQTATAFLWQPNGITTHVSSNSWGPQDDGSDLGRLGDLPLAALELATSTYRGGLGTVFVVSAGNGRGEGDNSSYDQYSGNRFVIGVGAVNKKGEPSSYSEEGMNVAVSALGGESAPPEMVWTTNNMGAESLAELKKNFETSEAPVNYTDAFNGTSAAAPQVSGAVALLLERNPRLGYRDVKEILMATARREGLSGGDAFVRNGGGFQFSHSFGAGVIDVAAALERAANWQNLGPLVSVEATAQGEALIPDGALAGATATLDFTGGNTVRIEHVELTVTVEHSLRGDLGFVIISPSGMVSIAEPREADEGEDFVNYKFTSVRHWGESSSGVWRVRVIDTEENDEIGLLTKATLKFFGTAR